MSNWSDPLPEVYNTTYWIIIMQFNAIHTLTLVNLTSATSLHLLLSTGQLKVMEPSSNHIGGETFSRTLNKSSCH